MPSAAENFPAPSIVMTDTDAAIWTAGHSNRSIEEFAEVLRAHSIDMIVDIRALPHSTRHPHFNQDSMRQELNGRGFTYHWAGRQLGGLRKVSANSDHIALDESLRGFADHMATESFRIGVTQLTGLANSQRVAVVCAEKDFRNCHRRLLSDFLFLNGIRVLHIQNSEFVEEHELNPLARVESEKIVYDNVRQRSIVFH